MQLWQIDSSLLVLLIEVLIAFLLIIAVGLYRFSKELKYRLWSIAWIIYSVTATVMVLATSSEGLSLIDAVASGGMMLSALLLVDGTHERSRRDSYTILLYPLFFAIGFVLVPIGIATNLTFGVVFAPGAILTAYACWSSAIQFMKKTQIRNIDYWTLILGLIFWGSAQILFPINIFVDVLAIQYILTSTGLIAVGAGLLNVLIRETSESLKVQHAITLLMNGIVNHDIRNYIGTLQESIDQLQGSDTDKEFWLDLSSEIISNMAEFVEEIRHISAGITRFEAARLPIEVNDLLRGVKERVTREYNLAPDVISIAIDEDTFVLTNVIVKEMFWNIIDNAFKHGCKNLHIKEKGHLDDVVTLEIRDDAGGLPSDVSDFLNDTDSLSSPAAPGMGLGIILIKGLSILCGVRLKTENVSLDGQTVGTVFNLEFKLPSVQQGNQEQTTNVK